MKESGDNIEKLFKDTFRNYESDVRPETWSQIQHHIHPSAGGISGGITKAFLGKIAGGLIAAGVIGASAFFIFNNIDTKENPEIKKEISQTMTADVRQPVLSDIKETQQDRIIKQDADQQKTLSQSENNLTASPGSPALSEKSNKTNISEPVTAVETVGKDGSAHRYGNAPKDDGGMVRGNNITTNKPGSPDPATSVDAAATLPVANIFVNTTYGEAPLSVSFINQGSGNSWAWDFGDGSFSKEAAPSHIYSLPGTYIATLTVKNNTGTATDKVTIEVKHGSEISYIPNIFTPNGDGDNDLFSLQLKNIATVAVVIYNQQNGIVYSWKTLDGAWNGKMMNGEDADVGIYFYTIHAVGTDGVSHTEKGTLTLKR